MFSKQCQCTLVFLNLFVLLAVFADPVQSVNVTYHDNGFKSLSLEERINVQKSTVHWYPYQKILYHVQEDGSLYEVCPEPESSIEDFLTFWTREQRLMGLITIHFLVVIYFFTFLAFICDIYFIPSVERICEALKISQDVAASTFMATATCVPEFFTYTISIFISDSDLGLGAIIGSMLFNTLGVAACASLFAKKPIQIDWWPITRDSILFSINLSVLATVIWDGTIMWYESMIFLVLYIGYWLFMFQNVKIMKFVKYIVEDKLMWCQRIKNYDIANQQPYENGKPTGENLESNNADSHVKDGGIRESYRGYNNNGFEGSTPDMGKIESMGGRDERRSTDVSTTPDMDKIRSTGNGNRRKSTDLSVIYNQEMEEIEEVSLWRIPSGSTFDIVWFFITWPIRFILNYTIPNPTKHKKWYPLTFLMCIIWIGVVSYVIFWMAVIIGDTFEVPEPVMGYVLGFGSCMPEAITSIIIVRKGSGQMGVSNSLGANSLAILFSLGLPWFIKTMADGAWVNDASFSIDAPGIQFTILGLLPVVATLYIVLSAAGYRMRKTVGAILGSFFIAYATVIILSELNIIFESDRC